MRTTFIFAAMLAGTSCAFAQGTPPTIQPPAQTATTPAPQTATTPAPQTATTPAPQTATTPASQTPAGPVSQTDAPPVSQTATRPAPPSPERLREVKFMESILANAVSQGAVDLARHMQETDPGSIVSINQGRARGIALEGYGVLFDVDVPLMNLSVVYTRKQLLMQDLRDQISSARRVEARASADDRVRLEAQIQLLTRQLEGLAPPPLSAPNPATPVAETTQTAAAGSVVAQSVDIASVPALDTRSTDEMYTDAIKKALIDAMVNHSSALGLTNDEWLTVAARDNGGPSIPGTFDDRSGIILRIKGSDLAAFRANKLSRDEVVTKVEIEEWR